MRLLLERDQFQLNVEVGVNLSGTVCTSTPYNDI